jgi:hypothetical protein
VARASVTQNERAKALLRSRLILTEVLKRLGGDKKRIGCAPINLSPDGSMKSQRDVRLRAPPNAGNLLPSDAIGGAVYVNISRSRSRVAALTLCHGRDQVLR